MPTILRQLRGRVGLRKPDRLESVSAFLASAASSLLPRHSGPFLARLRKTDGNRLLTARDLTARTSAVQGPGLAHEHGALDLGRSFFPVTRRHNAPPTYVMTRQRQRALAALRIRIQEPVDLTLRRKPVAPLVAGCKSA